MRLRESTMWSSERQSGPTKIIGPAYTVRFISKDEDPDADIRGHYVCH